MLPFTYILHKEWHERTVRHAVEASGNLSIEHVVVVVVWGGFGKMDCDISHHYCHGVCDVLCLCWEMGGHANLRLGGVALI